MSAINANSTTVTTRSRNKRLRNNDEYVESISKQCPNTPRNDSKKTKNDAKLDEKYRNEFDYVLANIERNRRFNQIELIPDEEFKTDLTASLFERRRKQKDRSKLDFVSQLMDENYTQTDMNQMKTRGERDINNLVKINELLDSVSLEKVSSIKDLDYDSICVAIYCYASHLTSLMSDSNRDSFCRRMFDQYGYHGITSNINISIFETWQIYYILGCLNGLFDRKLHNGLFEVVFPETLIRIVMRVNKLSYKEALLHLKPSISED